MNCEEWFLRMICTPVAGGDGHLLENEKGNLSVKAAAVEGIGTVEA
jgi:hypothetical protein